MATPEADCDVYTQLSKFEVGLGTRFQRRKNGYLEQEDLIKGLNSTFNLIHLLCTSP